MPGDKSKLVAKIVRVAPGFDGTKVQVGDVVGVQGALERSTAFEVTGVIDSNGNVHPVPPGLIFINHQYLEVLEDSVKDAYGKFDFELRYEKPPLNIVICQYENVLTVSVTEKFSSGLRSAPGGFVSESVNTLYTQNYMKDFDGVKRAVEQELLTGDADDLIFKLQEIKDREMGAKVQDPNALTMPNLGRRDPNG